MNRMKKSAACALCAALALNLAALPAFAAEESSTAKDENVFITLGADGSVQSQTVSNWLHAEAGLNGFEDTSSLTDITNLKGEDVPEQNGRALIWHTEGKDVYYQGKTDATPPITAAITYTLDGKSMPAEDMIGRSGHVVITVALQNSAKQQRTIDGKSRTVYTPFATAVGAMLPVDHFTSVKAPDGTVQTDSNTQVVGFVCLPGMKQNFDGLLTGKFSDVENAFLDSVSIEADTTDFTAPSFVIACASEASALSGKEELRDFSGVFSDLDKLSTATDTLVDAAQKLADGTGTLATGTGTLNSGASSLVAGAGQLQSGIAQLSGGLSTLAGNNAALSAGTQQIVDGIFSSSTQLLQSQLVAAGMDAAAAGQIVLTPATYTQVLTQLAGTPLTPTAAQLAQADSTILAALGAQGVPAALQRNVMKLAGSYLGAGTSADSQSALAAAGGLVPDTATVATIMDPSGTFQAAAAADPALSGGIAQLSAVLAAAPYGYDAQTAALTANTAFALWVSGGQAGAPTDQVAAAAAKVANYAVLGAAVPVPADGSNPATDPDIAVLNGRAAAEALASGAATQFAALKGQLDSVITYQTSLAAYEAGVATANEGAQKLSAGMTELSGGIAKLKAGTDELQSGANQLQSGANQLAKGTVTYRDEGVGQITDSPEIESLQGILDVTDAMREQASGYTTYTGAPAGASGSVKFIMKTAEVKASETAKAAQATAAPRPEEKPSFWQRVLSLFSFSKK